MLLCGRNVKSHSLKIKSFLLICYGMCMKYMTLDAPVLLLLTFIPNMVFVRKFKVGPALEYFNVGSWTSLWNLLATVHFIFRYFVEYKNIIVAAQCLCLVLGLVVKKWRFTKIVFEMKINHRSKALAAFVWKFFILTVIATVGNFDFYVGNLTFCNCHHKLWTTCTVIY
jgi:hypothetical protein